MVHDGWVGSEADRAAGQAGVCGCSSVVEHLLAKERVESSNLFIRFFDQPSREWYSLPTTRFEDGFDRLQQDQKVQSNIPVP